MDATGQPAWMLIVLLGGIVAVGVILLAVPWDCLPGDAQAQEWADPAGACQPAGRGCTTTRGSPRAEAEATIDGHKAGLMHEIAKDKCGGVNVARDMRALYR